VPGTDGVQLDANLWGSIKVEPLEANARDDAHTGKLGTFAGGAPSGWYAQVSLKGCWKGAGVAYGLAVMPEYQALLSGCGVGLVATTTAGNEKWVGTLQDTASATFTSLTLYAYAAGTLFKITGALGKLSWDFQAGKYGFWTMDFTGVVSTAGAVSDAALPSITYPRIAVQPPIGAGATLSLNGVGVPWKSFTGDTGAEISEKPRGNSADGHAGYEITNFAPTAKASFDSPVKATLDPWALRRAGTQFPWSFGPVGSTQYNRVTLGGSKTQITSVDHQEDKYAMVNVGLRLVTDPNTAPLTITLD
jgi:hypothetical protein